MCADRPVGDRRRDGAVAWSIRSRIAGSWATSRVTIRLLIVRLETSLVARSDPHVDVRDEAPEAEGARRRDAVDRAVVGLVGVAADDEVDLGVEAADDVDDRAGHTCATVDVQRRRRSALVDEHDDRLDVLARSSGTSALTVSASSWNSRPWMPAALTISGVPSRVIPMNATLAPLKFRIEYGANRVSPVAVRDHVRGEEVEVGPREGRAVLAAVDGWQPPLAMRRSSVGALVELVVADGVEVEPDLVHRLDRGLVVEQRREDRAGADQVARGDHDRVGVRRLQVRRCAWRGTRHRRRASVPTLPLLPVGGQQVAVEVVESEDLHLDLGPVLDDRRLRRLGRGQH